MRKPIFLDVSGTKILNIWIINCYDRLVLRIQTVYKLIWQCYINETSQGQKKLYGRVMLICIKSLY